MLTALVFGLQTVGSLPAPPPTVLLVEVTQPARYIGTPRVCTEPDETGEVPICFMELYEADVRVLRRWDGPAVARRLTVRFTAHSFRVVWQRGTRFILVLEPFEDAGRAGLFASYWDWEDDNEEFCNPDETIARMDANLAAIYRRGRLRTIRRDTDEWSAGVIRCATGRERAH